MNRFEFYRELYFKSHEDKNEINNSFSMHIGIVSAVVVSYYFLISSFKYQDNVVTEFYILILLITGIFFFLSLFHIIQGHANLFKGYSYYYIPDCKQIEKVNIDLKRYYAELGATDLSEQDLEENLILEYVNCTDANRINNQIKIYHRYISMRYLITVIVLTVLVLIIYGIGIAH